MNGWLSKSVSTKCSLHNLGIFGWSSLFILESHSFDIAASCYGKPKNDIFFPSFPIYFFKELLKHPTAEQYVMIGISASVKQYSFV